MTINLKKYKQIPGFDGYYISKSAEIYSAKTNIIMRQSVDAYGYLQIGLRDPNHKYRKIKVHRLMMLTFKLPVVSKKFKDGIRCINHKDGNKTNNHISNLEICSHKYNHDHARKTGLMTPMTKEGKKRVSAALKKRWARWKRDYKLGGEE